MIDQLLSDMAIDEFMEFMSELFPDLIDDLAIQAMRQAWLDLEYAEAHRAAAFTTQRFDWQENYTNSLESVTLLHWLISTKHHPTSRTEDQLLLP